MSSLPPELKNILQKRRVGISSKRQLQKLFGASLVQGRQVKRSNSVFQLLTWRCQIQFTVPYSFGRSCTIDCLCDQPCATRARPYSFQTAAGPTSQACCNCVDMAKALTRAPVKHRKGTASNFKVRQAPVSA